MLTSSNRPSLVVSSTIPTPPHRRDRARVHDERQSRVGFVFVARRARRPRARHEPARAVVPQLPRLRLVRAVARGPEQRKRRHAGDVAPRTGVRPRRASGARRRRRGARGSTDIRARASRRAPRTRRRAPRARRTRASRRARAATRDAASRRGARAVASIRRAPRSATHRGGATAPRAMATSRARSSARARAATTTRAARRGGATRATRDATRATRRATLEAAVALAAARALRAGDARATTADVRTAYDAYAPTYDDLDGGGAARALGAGRACARTRSRGARATCWSSPSAPGSICARTTRAGCETYTAIDLSPGMLARARARAATMALGERATVRGGGRDGAAVRRRIVRRRRRHVQPVRDRGIRRRRCERSGECCDRTGGRC